MVRVVSIRVAKASAGGAGRGKVGRTILTAVDVRFDVVCKGFLSVWVLRW